MRLPQNGQSCSQTTFPLVGGVWERDYISALAPIQAPILLSVWSLVPHPATSLLLFATPGQVITQDREWQLGDWKPYSVPKSQVSISCVSRRCPCTLQIVFVKWKTEEEEHSVVEGKLVQLCDNKGGYDDETEVKVLGLTLLQ